MNNPKVLIADEPTGNLDPTSAEKVLNILHKLNTEDGTTILMVTHNMSLIQKKPARVLVIEKGKVVRDISKIEITKLLGV